MKEEMKETALYHNKTLLSYEVFPPKPNSPVSTIYETIQELRYLQPDFISVTYGAGGGSNSQSTFQIASDIAEQGIQSVAHLPCIGSTKEEIKERLDKLKELGLRNILALRGDIPEGGCPEGDFKYASDLIDFILSQDNFNIIAACYPEGHNESKNRVHDIRHLKRKVEAGARHLITQMFFDNSFFYSFQECCALADIDVPIEAGIMPVINKRQIQRMTSLCGVSVPKKFMDMMDRFEHNPIAMRDAGIAYAIDQIVDLITHGVAGIHLYTMNNPYIAKQIHEAVYRLL